MAKGLFQLKKATMTSMIFISGIISIIMQENSLDLFLPVFRRFFPENVRFFLFCFFWGEGTRGEGRKGGDCSAAPLRSALMAILKEAIFVFKIAIMLIN